MSYYCYLVQCADGTFYTGSTNDVAKRVATHNAGKGAKYTRNRRPVKLLYQQAFAEKHDALSFEAKFKQHSRRQKEAFLRAHHVTWR
ncbi:MAG: GIY-YIG nuclease family protein [Lactobacillaceae bacterium]|nr:GIY-YIG nuclease family protein [Lactobacillaceae bacterium]